METTQTKKSNKKKIAIALILCLILLVGVVYAALQITNKATNVQLITIGSIDVSLVDGDGTEITDDLELQFSGYESEDEDSAAVIYGGETLTLENIYLKNDSDVSVTYTVEITEPSNDDISDEIITWATTIGGTTYSSTTTYTVTAGSQSDAIVVTGTVADDIDSDYMGLDLDGLVVTVTATEAAD